MNKTTQISALARLHAARRNIVRKHGKAGREALAPLPVRIRLYRRLYPRSINYLRQISGGGEKHD